MGRQRWVYHIEHSRFPPDFLERLKRFKEASGLSWRGLARRLRIDIRMLHRWRNGVQPGSGHVVALYETAAEMGLLHHFLPALGEPETVTASQLPPGRAWMPPG